MHGWLILDKPLGLSSSQAVGAVKRVLRQGGYPKLKIGHGGTLDPLATGVLPIALGEATKLTGRMLDADKAYAFTIGFGIETDTLDAEGVEIARSDVRPTRAAVEAVTLAARVSKGTYIRSLARDIAHALGTRGHVTMLRRTKAGPFTLDQAISLDKLEKLGQGRALEQALLPLTAGLDDIPALSVTADQARLLRQGQKLIGSAATDGLHLATEGPVPVALVEVSDREVRVVRGFNL